MARRYDRLAKHERVRFTADLRRVIIEGCRDICSRRDWRLHHVVVVSSHFHPLVSWRDRSLKRLEVRDTIKRLVGMMLAQHAQQPGRRWLSRKGPPKPVPTREHFEHLMSRYLPGHARGARGGSGWCERIGYYGAQFANEP